MLSNISAAPIAAWLLLSAMPAHAETTSEAAAPAAAANPDVGEILVTARKRAEIQRDVPVAITAIGGSQLSSLNIARLTDVGAIVPNFTLSLAAGQPYTYIRGFGSGGNSSFEQAVGKFVDNVSYGRDFFARIPLYDIDRLEVLKGPQVLLYGNSATAGALNITTTKPGRKFEADGSVSYEFNEDEVLTQGGVTVPIADWASLRVGGFYQNLAKGWIHNDGTGTDDPRIRNYGVRPTLRLTPAPGLEILLKAEIDRLRDNGSAVQPIRQAASPARAFPEVNLDDHRNSDYSGAPFFSSEYNELHSDTYQGDVKYDVLGGTLSSTTAYVTAHEGNASGNASQLPALLATIDYRYHQFSQELRFNRSIGPVDLLVGGYYQHDTLKTVAPIQVNPAAYGLPLPAISRLSTMDQRSNGYSMFGDLTWHLSSKLSIEAGGRYAIVRKTTDQASNPTPLVPGLNFGSDFSALQALINPALNGVFTAVFGAVPHDLKGIRTREEHFQPQVVAQYYFIPRNMVYARYAKGDKAGGVDFLYTGSVATGATAQGASFAPEKAESEEIGIKGITADNRFEYALSIYNTTFSNLQTSVFIGTAAFVSNVGKARSRGVEAEIAYRPVPGLRLNASGAIQRAKYLDYPGAPCTVAQALATPAGTVCKQDLSGARTPFGSDYSLTVGATYDIAVGSLRVTPGVSVTARSHFNTSSNNDPLGTQHGFATIDAHLDVTPDHGPWSLSLFGRDLGGVRYKEYSVATPLVPGGFNTWISRGRQIGLRLGARF